MEAFCVYSLTGIVWGGGQDRPCDEKFCEKCHCSHYNNTNLIKLP